MNIEDFEWIVISTDSAVGAARLERLLPRLADEGIVPKVMRFEPKPYFSDAEINTFRKRWGNKFITRYETGNGDITDAGIHPGTPGCGESLAKAILSTNKPIIVLENDFVPVRFLKKRLQQEVLNYLPDDWAGCFASARYCSTIFEINPFIAICRSLIFSHITIWKGNKTSHQIAETIINGECYCYSAGYEKGLTTCVSKKNLPLYTTRLWYGGQDSGISETTEKGARKSILFQSGWSGFGNTEIVDEGKISCGRLEFAICGGCNLRCKNCSHYAPFAHWTTPVETVLESIKTAAERIKPATIRILGGEPLLHPQLPCIIEKTCELFDCSINVVTNGVGLPDHPHAAELLKLLEKYNHLYLTVNEYIPIENTMMWLQENNVRYHTERPEKFITFPVGKHVSNKYLAFHHSQHETVCFIHTCYTIIGNRLYRCSVQAHRAGLAKYGFVSGEVDKTFSEAVLQWDGIEFATASPMEIRNYLTATPYDECSLCYEEPEQVRLEQLRWSEYQTAIETLGG